MLCTDSESGDNSLQHRGAYCNNHKVVGSNMLPMKKIGLKKKIVEQLIVIMNIWDGLEKCGTHTHNLKFAIDTPENLL